MVAIKMGALVEVVLFEIVLPAGEDDGGGDCTEFGSIGGLCWRGRSY